ncbi:uncharacterized protein LOC132639746 [Lycium barbarum]|uniref:uncharacterized protein LOC132639746 n=1 Tax=Lycium barbarum TaxID=112863 RepID=UPI00293F55F2|nr:uncharacterized protein LOC132639746 [Lycium barbarum]
MVRQLIGTWGKLEQMTTGTLPTKSMTRSFYLQLLNNHERMNWKCLMFHNAARPKSVFILWLCLHGKLLTIDRLLSWGLSFDPVCGLCKTYNEDSEHLFVKCAYAQQLWSRVLTWLQQPPTSAQTWLQHLEWLINRGKGKSEQARLFRMVCAEVTNSVWTERNARIFEQRSREVERVAREIAYICNVRATPSLQSLMQSYTF